MSIDVEHLVNVPANFYNVVSDAQAVLEAHMRSCDGLWFGPSPFKRTAADAFLSESVVGDHPKTTSVDHGIPPVHQELPSSVSNEVDIPLFDEWLNFSDIPMSPEASTPPSHWDDITFDTPSPSPPPMIESTRSTPELSSSSSTSPPPSDWTFGDFGYMESDDESDAGSAYAPPPPPPAPAAKTAPRSKRATAAKKSPKSKFPARKRDNRVAKAAHSAMDNATMTAAEAEYIATRPYPCTAEGCKHRCKSSGDLSRHEESHGDKKFFCFRPGCDGVGFKRKDSYKRHMTAQHLWE
ncbi:hypothetical protein BD410DRAFT_515804 [Rickenella mellea]|uniref:C2H2-type domain-containing protein n=1 Tax=Rickenella mellea TaxID=50990 RepID=A0A4Y7PRC7_9AGAM|nr:hypothetical protein BD410DRAFT_515804 [Rickenella mellea]